MNKYIESKIKKIYNEVYKKVFTKERINSLSSGNKIGIDFAILKLKSSQKYEEFCKKFSKELAKKGLSQQVGVWKAYFEAAKKSHHIALPKTFKEFELNIYNNAVKNNLDMIRSIPDKIKETINKEYTDTLIEQVAKGSIGRNSFRKQLENHNIKNARTIARTETAKLQTLIVENRAKNLGSPAYIWKASKDRRTRDAHAAMNNVLVFWNNTPTFKHVNKSGKESSYQYNFGEFVNCRCAGNPIFEIEDIENFPIKVAENAILTPLAMSN